MNILLIDYISYKEHRNFNKIHIDVLLELGNTLTLVGKKRQFDEYKEDSRAQIINLPYEGNSLKEEIANLLWIKKNCLSQDVNIIVVLTYNILSLFTFRVSIPTFVINHTNVSQMDMSLKGKIKYLLTKSLPRNYSHICLNEEMCHRLLELMPNRNVYYVPHGICPISSKMMRPDFIKDKQYLFCPINRNFDVEFVNNLFTSSLLADTLESNDMILYVKDKLITNQSLERTIKVPNSLSMEEYNYLITHACAIILPYGKRFKYRCSGIFFECVARNIPIIATDINAMRIYKNDVNLFLFKDINGLLESINKLSENSEIINNKEVFNPYQYWQKILEK